MVKCDDLTHILFIVHYALESLGAFFFGPFYHDNYRKRLNFKLILFPLANKFDWYLSESLE